MSIENMKAGQAVAGLSRSSHANISLIKRWSFISGREEGCYLVRGWQNGDETVSLVRDADQRHGTLLVAEVSFAHITQVCRPVAVAESVGRTAVF